ncbi:unnamed protein product [Blepharisma stoltei]|uniref:Uncharacterized protein n=1 Tax=Blepharisma stoltei TaxID=1481888 RepID=A0AAU9KC27_9CILI|nr:unnamed protein product [Blepharisma stoltei]
MGLCITKQSIKLQDTKSESDEATKIKAMKRQILVNKARRAPILRLDDNDLYKRRQLTRITEPDALNYVSKSNEPV